MNPADAEIIWTRRRTAAPESATELPDAAPVAATPDDADPPAPVTPPKPPRPAQRRNRTFPED